MPVRRVLNHARSFDPDHYQNLGSELWYAAARLIEQKEVILLDDETLIEQMASRQSTYTNLGKMGLETKESMKSRGLSSPDRADAALSALSISDKMGNTYVGVLPDDFSELENEPDERDLAVLEEQWSGAFAGL